MGVVDVCFCGRWRGNLFDGLTMKGDFIHDRRRHSKVHLVDYGHVLNVKMHNTHGQLEEQTVDNSMNYSIFDWIEMSKTKRLDMTDLERDAPRGW